MQGSGCGVARGRSPTCRSSSVDRAAVFYAAWRGFDSLDRRRALTGILAICPVFRSWTSFEPNGPNLVRAVVAQVEERRFPKPEAADSSSAGGTRIGTEPLTYGPIRTDPRSQR